MAAPELRLNVSLDLGFFRQQLQKLTVVAQSEFAPKLNVKFNRQTLDRELNNLQAAIKRRTYRVEIGGNISELPGQIKALKQQLASLEGFKIDLGIGAIKSLSKKDAGKIRSDLRADILGEEKKIYIPTSIQAKISRDDVRDFKNAVKSKLTGLSVDVKVNAKGGGFAGSTQGAAGLMEYMRSQGMVGKTASGMEMRLGKDGGDIKQQLNDAVQSAEKIKSVFDGVAKSIATTGKSIANIQGKRLGLANVPLMAGGVEKRIERSAAAIGETTSSNALKALYPEVNKTVTALAALKGQIRQNSSKLSGFSLIIGLAAFAGVPLAKSIVKLTGSSDNFAKLLDKLGPRLEAAFTKAASSILSTASSRLLRGGNVAGLLPAAYRGIGPAAEPAGLLPPAYRGIEPTRNAGMLPPAYRGLPFGFDFKGLPPETRSGDEAGKLGPTMQQMRQQLFSSVRIAEVRVREIFDIVGDFNSRQKAAGQARLDKAVTDFVKGLEDIARRSILRGSVRHVNVSDLGGAVRAALPSGRSPLMLPPAGGTTAIDRMRVSTGAYLGQPGFMQAPSVPSSMGGGIIPPVPPSGGGGGRGGFFGGGRFNVPNLPGAGLVREIGEEFGFAAKQVLLFGAAYKGLAFLTGFPAQVGNAVAALQSFNNTLNAISPTAGEVAASNQLILDLVNKYNIPLQSARGGFTKLYASMQSAGFAGDEVRDIFTGITKAAATFGMSADKVDRVNYAFAQMASKGQVMSEELKGQLGDVLPGALGIFAEAAGFKGPDAIQKFSKALEDGAYKGEAMKQLLTNVGIVMNQEFGPGAEGAARTFQGVINRMQNSLTLLYESFEPVAVGFLNSVVMPMTSGLKTVTDGFNAFFTGAAAKSSGGFAIAQELEKLRPTFNGLRENAGQLIQLFGQFAQVALEAGKVLLQIAGNPIVGFMAKIYAIMVPINVALGVMRGLWALNSLQLLIFNARLVTGTTTLAAFRGMMAATGATAATTAATIRAGFASTGIGLVLVGIGLLIERFMSMNQALADTKTKALGAADAIRSMSQAEARQAENQATRDVKILQALQQKKNAGQAIVAITKEEQEALERAGVKTGKMVLPGQMARSGSLPALLGYGQQAVDVTQIQGAVSARQGIVATARRQIEDSRFQEQQTQQSSNLPPIPGVSGDGVGGTKPAKEQSLESYYSLQDQLAKNFTQDQIDRMEKEYQARVDRINAEFDLREARANSFQKEAIRYERQIAAIELKRQKALLDASNEVIKAQGSVAGGAGMTMGGIVAMTGGALSQDALTRGRSTGAHLHAQAAGVTEKTLRYLVDKYLEVGGKTASAFGQSRGSVGHGYNAIDFLTPQGTPIKLREGASIGQYGPAGGRGGLMAQVTTPEGNFQLGHLSSLASQAQAGIARKVTGSEKRDVVAEQKTQLAIAQKSLAVQIAEAQAIRDAAVAWAEYTNAITPIEEQKLQNSLLTKKNELVKSGLPDDVIEKEMKQFETQQKTAIAIGIVNKQRADGLIGKDEEVKRIAELNENMAIYNGLLADSLTLQNQQKFDESMGALRKQLEIAGIIDPRAELRARIRQEKPGYSEGQVEEEAAMQERIGQLETAKERIKGVAGAIGDAFGEAFKGIVTGSMTAQEALAGMFQSIADHFADMVAQMIAEWLKAQLIQGFMNIFSSLIPGVGSLGGGGSVLGGNSSAVFGINSADMNQYAPLLPMANGGVLSGGFRAFANGGIVTGPTLGLVGEGRYNEAVIPLPDGRSVPVELSGGGSSSPTVIVNVDAKGSQVEGDEQNANQLGRVISAAVQTELIKQQRPGGLLASRR